MNLYVLPPLFCGLAALALGLFVWWQNKRSPVNITFLLNSLTTFWWQFCWGLLFSTSNPTWAELFVRVGYSGIIFIPITFYHFFANFLAKKKELKLVYLSYFMGLGFLVALWTSKWYINGVYRFFWGFYPRASLLHLVYLFMLFFIVVRMIYILKQGLEVEPSSVRYNQIKYLLLALLFYVLAAFDFLVNYGLEFYPLGFIPVMISLGIIAFAVVRHRLMDITVIIRKTVVYSLLTALLTGLFIFIVLLGNYLLGQYLGEFSIWFGVGAAFLVAVIFQPLRNRLQVWIDEKFFKAKYEYQKTIKNLSQSAVSIVDLDQLLGVVIRDVSDTMKVEKVSVYTLSKSDGNYDLKEGF